MMTFKIKSELPALCALALIALILILTGCGAGASTEDNASGTVSFDLDNYDFSYTDRELDPSYDESAAVKIILADDGCSVSGDGSMVTIDSGGTYILSGSLSDGRIVIETPDDQKVQLVLDDADISCSDNAPVLIRESDKVFITLAEGSSNSLTGPSVYSDEASEDSVDGVIFSKADLCINGSGALNITANSGHGIVSKDDLVVTGGSLSITAPEDGLQGKDCVKIKDGTFVIEADNNAIKSSNAEDETRGFVSIDGGRFTLTAGYDGIQAETLLRTAGGDFSITTGGGSEYASTQSDWGGGNNRQTPGDMMMSGGGMHEDSRQAGADSAQTDDTSSDTVSAKGLKGNLGVVILGGSLSIDSSDDSIHSNGDVYIQGGDISISSGDDGIHADSDLLVTDGTLAISQSYEGIEGNTITIDGGNIDITASDDGLNAAGGAGQNSFAVDESAFIRINGGELNIAASGDGIDSNGSLDIADGYLTVSCPVMGDTSVMDYASEGSITGGTFIGTGAVQMAQTFSASEQGVISVSTGEQAAGSVIALTDSSGNKVMTYDAPQSFSVVILSSPDIVSGETYTLQAGSSSGEVTAN